MSNPDSAALQKLLVEAVREHNVLPLTGRCNLSCCFCSHGQNPPGTQAFTFPPVEPALLRDLIPYLDPMKKVIIGESATRLREGEPLTHPHFSDVLEQLRARFPATPIQVTTNAALLDRGLIRRLASLAPLEVVFSLNSATPRGRRLLMGDRQPERAIAAVKRLAATGVPLHGSVVGVPHLAGWPDLSFTLRYLDDAGARTIRLLLPGYTRFSRPSLVPPPGTLDRCWDLAAELRLQAPLLVEPPRIRDLAPVIDGVIGGSPAAAAGLQAGDTILGVNGVRPLTRVDAFNRIRREENPRLLLSRGGRPVEATPVKGKGEAPGMVMAFDLDPAQVERVRRRLLPQGRTLMLTSGAALERWQWVSQACKLTGLQLAAVPSLFFGGSINSAGLLTVTDFRAVLRREQARLKPGRVLLPAAAFDGGGFDLAGRHYRALQEAGVPVELLP